MTQRSIPAGTNPKVIIKVGGSVVVKGHESDYVSVETKDKWGLQVEQRSEAEVRRARAAVGDHILFDWRIKLPPALRSLSGEADSDEAIVVQMGGSGEVLVPLASRIESVCRQEH